MNNKQLASTTSNRKSLSNRIQKLIRQNEKQTVIEPQPDPVLKVPVWKNTKWTKEKIEQLKAEKLAAREQRKKQKLEGEKLTKISSGAGLNIAERTRIAQQTIKSKKEIEETIVAKRNQQKQIEQKNDFQPKCTHIDKFSHFTMNGGVVTACKHCSRMKEWDPREWHLYMLGARKEL